MGLKSARPCDSVAADAGAVRRLRKAAADLLSWYDRCRRPLPWRSPLIPYHTWISEIMLQQTRIDVVIGYYERFLEHFPDIRTLAFSSEDELLKCWEGLGYYNRARNLRRAAGIVMEEHGGQLPRTKKELAALPGIGDYTAAAISSIVFGEAEPAVDGNVLRVCARLLEDGSDVLLPATRKKVSSLLSQVIPADRPGDFNEALMELGETVCLPEGQALCSGCPVKRHCLAYANGTAAALPVRIKKTSKKEELLTVLLIVSEDGSVAVRRRPSEGLLPGLFEFPNVPGHLGPEDIRSCIDALLSDQNHILEITSLPDQTHVFSHRKWLMKAYRVSVGISGLSSDRAADSGKAPGEQINPGEAPPGQIIFAPPADLESVYSIPGAFSRFKQFI